MHKRWYIFTAILCICAIALSCLWMLAPNKLAPNAPTTSIKNDDYYLLLDQGGLVQILHYTPDCPLPQPVFDHAQAALCVNLLPEQHALRVKAGYRIASEEHLTALLAELRASIPAPRQAPLFSANVS